MKIKTNADPWVFKKHTNNIGLLTELALYLKSNKADVSIEEKNKMYDEFSKTTKYNPRKSLRNKPLDAINHKIDALSYYMFGYSDMIDGSKKFIFSPLGNLYLKYLNNDETLAKIFTTMLIGMQFSHPSSKPSEKFSLYPFRLIFELLNDVRLEGYLYHYEIYTYVMYVTYVTEDIYEDLIKNILKSRKQTDDEKFTYLKEREHEIVKSVYEWQYYVSSMLEDINIIEKYGETDYIDLYHRRRPTSKSKATKRKANNGKFRLTKFIKPFVTKLLKQYTIYDQPLKLDTTNRMSNDIVKEIYLFYPEELLKDIGEISDSAEINMLKLPKLIEEYSNNPNNETYDLFEDVLVEGFNMFVNVEARKLSGPGRTDIECLYLTLDEKFAVDAKSTSTKLSSINSGRLARHRSLIGAKYTIVVTPRYVPSVRYDIEGSKIVIIKANTLSEYLYNNMISNNREMDYGEIRDIIVKNIGKDISLEISELTLTKFG